MPLEGSASEGLLRDRQNTATGPAFQVGQARWLQDPLLALGGRAHIGRLDSRVPGLHLCKPLAAWTVDGGRGGRSPRALLGTNSTCHLAHCCIAQSLLPVQPEAETAPPQGPGSPGHRKWASALTECGRPGRQQTFHTGYPTHGRPKTRHVAPLQKGSNWKCCRR